MANKRMFSKQITTSDAFIDMPVSSQLLYFHLNMEADDDGFVSNPKRIVRMLNAGDDDLKILLAKRFLLGFESGVVVVKHWLLHNAVRKDMYKETHYLEEKKGLKIKENGAYTEVRNESVTNPLHRLDKVRLGQDRLDKVILSASADPWDFNKYLKQLKEHIRKDLSIIGYYWESKGFEFENLEQAQSAVKRDLKAAGLLKGYDIKRVQHTLEYLSGNSDFKWTLETVSKFIDEPKVKNYNPNQYEDTRRD